MQLFFRSLPLLYSLYLFAFVFSMYVLQGIKPRTCTSHICEARISEPHFHLWYVYLPFRLSLLQSSLSSYTNHWILFRYVICFPAGRVSLIPFLYFPTPPWPSCPGWLIAITLSWVFLADDLSSKNLFYTF